MKKKITIGIVVLAAGTVLALFAWPQSKAPDPKTQTPADVTRFLASAEFDKLNDEQKDDYYSKLADNSETTRAFRGPISEFSEEERDRLRRNTAPIFEKMMQKRVDQYFDQPIEKRDEYMDALIDEMQSSSGRQRGLRGYGGQEGPDDRSGGEPRRQRMHSAPAGGSAIASSPDEHDRRPPQRNITNDASGAMASRSASSDMRRRWIDRRRYHMQSTPPEVRAKFVEFRKQLRKRMEERRTQSSSTGANPPGQSSR